MVAETLADVSGAAMLCRKRKKQDGSGGAGTGEDDGGESAPAGGDGKHIQLA